MSVPVTIVGLSGSTRAGSFNTALLRAAAELAPPRVSLPVETVAGFPAYDADVEAERGLPERAVELKATLARADGLLISSPEYNAGIPGAAKNAIDWLSRPAGDIPEVFGGLHVALIGATPGRGGTRFAQAGWLPVLRYLSCSVWSAKTLYVAGARDAFDAEGILVDETVRRLLAELVEGFAAHCASQRRHSA